MYRKILVFAILIGLLTAGLVFAQNSSTTTTTTTVEKGFYKSNEQYVEPLYGMVVKFEGNDIVTNLGETKNIKPGTKFYVYRVKTFIGVVQVYEVSNWTSLAKIISVEKGQTINRGDRLSDKELEFRGDAIYIKGTSVEITTTSSSGSSGNTGSSSSAKIQTEDINTDSSSKTNFSKDKKNKPTSMEEILKKHMRTANFKKKGAAQRKMEMPSVNIPGVPDLEVPTASYSGNGFLYNTYGFNLMDILQTGAWISLFTNNTYNNAIYTSNWPLYSSLGFTAYSRYNNIKQYEKVMGMITNADVVVIKWDEDMAYEIASLMAYKEAINDQGRINQMAEEIIKNKKIKDNLVFEVRIKSIEDGAISFAPWSYHMYLIDSQGNRVKTENYSATLDQGLTKGQSSVGYVYFKKIYDTNKVKIVLEDMLGSKEISMNF